MASFEILNMKIKKMKEEIDYIKWTLDNENFDCDTLLFIFQKLKIPDIDKIIEDKKKQDEIIMNVTRKLYEK